MNDTTPTKDDFRGALIVSRMELIRRAARIEQQLQTGRSREDFLRECGAAWDAAAQWYAL